MIYYYMSQCLIKNKREKKFSMFFSEVNSFSLCHVFSFCTSDKKNIYNRKWNQLHATRQMVLWLSFQRNSFIRPVTLCSPCSMRCGCICGVDLLLFSLSLSWSDIWTDRGEFKWRRILLVHSRARICMGRIHTQCIMSFSISLSRSFFLSFFCPECSSL
jgi:hypothetical protein